MRVSGGGWAYGSFVGPHEALSLDGGECGADRMLRTTQWTRASLIRVIQSAGHFGVRVVGDDGSQF